MEVKRNGMKIELEDRESGYINAETVTVEQIVKTAETNDTAVKMDTSK